MAHDSAAYDWSQFHVYMDIRAPPEAVFDAWATSAGMASFFVRDMTYTGPEGNERAPGERSGPGDSYTLQFHHTLGFAGRVLEAEAPTRFVFTFPDVMHVAIELHAGGGITRVHLHQTNIQTDPASMVMSHMNCRSCWIYYLMNLKSVLEHGIDLRDVDRPLADNIVGVPFHEAVAAGRLTS